MGHAYFCLGQLEEAATQYERALGHGEEMGWIYRSLAATYGLLGRDSAARDALDKYIKARGSTPYLSLVMCYVPFRDPDVADRYADGLLKAGIPGVPGGYYKLADNNRLTGNEIEGLVFGHTMTGVNSFLSVWFHDFGKDGQVTSRGPGAADTYDTGSCWVEDDLLCCTWKTGFRGQTLCDPIFRNPDGTPQMRDEFIRIKYCCAYPMYEPFSIE
jgi:hypothetical protein